MNNIIIPPGYTSALGIFDTQVAIGKLKQIFQDNLARALNLKRVSAPLFVDPDTGLNDDLNGIERPVSFDIPASASSAQIVHSLAKWKRMALHQYDFHPGVGLYTDMNAIRRDEDMDNIHSIYVDQWDWEKVILPEQRNIDYLKQTVCSIVGAICDTLDTLKSRYPKIMTEIKRDVSFITSEQLLQMYPDLAAKERENAYLKEHKTAFILQIGDVLSNGEKHDGRAPDYDDWQLNGDLLVWNEVLGSALELSSMGIRVDQASLASQLEKANCTERSKLLFHKMLLDGKLPLCIGGGIGQSRLCMLMLGKTHIGEVQVSIWDQATIDACEQAGIILL